MMPTSFYNKIFLTRIGRSLSNLSIFAAVVCAASLLAGILTAFYMLFMILFVFAAIVMTLFIILLYYPDIFSLINAEAADDIIHFLIENVAPPASVVAAVAGAVSLVFLFLGEPKKNVGRIIFSGVVTVLGIVVAIAAFSARG